MFKLIKNKNSHEGLIATELADRDFEHDPELGPVNAIALQSNRPLLRILIANTKGGSGKTTLSTNLASCYAASNYKTVLMDFDPQGSSTQWHRLRPPELEDIHLIRDKTENLQVTRSWLLHPPRSSERVVMDSPAACPTPLFEDLLNRCDVILVPVLPSPIDIKAVSQFIQELLLNPLYRKNPKRIAVVANRVKKNTLVYEKLERFLSQLRIPFVTSFRDTQWYVKAFDKGNGIFEVKSPQVTTDLQDWERLVSWLEKQAIYIHR